MTLCRIKQPRLISVMHCFITWTSPRHFSVTRNIFRTAAANSIIYMLYNMFASALCRLYIMLSFYLAVLLVQMKSVSEWVSEQFLNGTSAQCRLFSAIPLKVEKGMIFRVSVWKKTNELQYKRKAHMELYWKKKGYHQNWLYKNEVSVMQCNPWWHL